MIAVNMGRHLTDIDRDHEGVTGTARWTAPGVDGTAGERTDPGAGGWPPAPRGSGEAGRPGEKP
jgi:hypothetical protein